MPILMGVPLGGLLPVTGIEVPCGAEVEVAAGGVVAAGAVVAAAAVVAVGAVVLTGVADPQAAATTITADRPTYSKSFLFIFFFSPITYMNKIIFTGRTAPGLPVFDLLYR